MHSSLILLVICLMASAESGDTSQKVPTFNESDLAVYPSMGLEAEWGHFMGNFSKKYANETEEMRRKEIFGHNLKGIVDHNKLYTEGHKTSFTMAVNGYSDMKTSEVLQQMAGLKAVNEAENKQSFTFSDSDTSIPQPPSEIEYFTKGYVTPVKNQQTCGSCWAFATTGALEGQHFRTTRKLVSLSEQQLLDCDKSNGACNGGWTHKAYQYIESNGGINAEETYPYDAVEKQCRYRSDKVARTCRGYAQVYQSELALMKAVNTLGPIAVAIDISPPSFQQYKEGVYDEPLCSNTTHNHAVLVVGYGSTPTGKQYWLVKNSWGTGWGNKGYIYMSRNKMNQCAIASYAVYPLI